MLKCKNEATKLLKTKESSWVRFQNEPILGAERTHFFARANPFPSLRPDAYLIFSSSISKISVALPGMKPR
jgi:hypothetical protein